MVRDVSRGDPGESNNVNLGIMQEMLLSSEGAQVEHGTVHERQGDLSCREDAPQFLNGQLLDLRFQMELPRETLQEDRWNDPVGPLLVVLESRIDRRVLVVQAAPFGAAMTVRCPFKTT